MSNYEPTQEWWDKLTALVQRMGGAANDSPLDVIERYVNKQEGWRKDVQIMCEHIAEMLEGIINE